MRQTVAIARNDATSPSGMNNVEMITLHGKIATRAAAARPAVVLEYRLVNQKASGETASESTSGNRDDPASPSPKSLQIRAAGAISVSRTYWV